MIMLTLQVEKYTFIQWIWTTRFHQKKYLYAWAWININIKQKELETKANQLKLQYKNMYLLLRRNFPLSIYWSTCRCLNRLPTYGLHLSYCNKENNYNCLYTGSERKGTLLKLSDMFGMNKNIPRSFETRHHNHPSLSTLSKSR